MGVEGAIKPVDHSKVEFLRYHKPPLDAGNYRVTATQNVAALGPSEPQIAGNFSDYSVARVRQRPLNGTQVICLKLGPSSNAIWVFDKNGDMIIDLDGHDLKHPS